MKLLLKELKNLRTEIDVPWGKEKDPKKILTGEILLIRTRYDQAKKVYEEFLAYFPDLQIEPEEEKEALTILLKAGLKHRAEGLLKTLKLLCKGVPINTELPYVSKYVLSAVNFLTGKSDFLYPDSNIIRFFNRYFGITNSDKTHPSEKHVKLMKLITRFGGRDNVLKVLDFSILICKVKPECERCPLQKHCGFVKKNQRERKS